MEGMEQSNRSTGTQIGCGARQGCATPSDNCSRTALGSTCPSSIGWYHDHHPTGQQTKTAMEGRSDQMYVLS